MSMYIYIYIHIYVYSFSGRESAQGKFEDA